MGEEDTRRQALNVFRMELLGARVIPVRSGSGTLKDAMNEALRDWVTNVRTTYYCIGLHRRPPPVPDDGPRPPVGDRARGAAAARRAPRRARGLRGRRVQRARPLLPVPRRPRGPPGRRGGGGRGAPERPPRGAALGGYSRRASRQPVLRDPGRGRPGPARPFHLGGARLPGRRARALLAAGHRPRRVRRGDRRGGARRPGSPHAARGHHPGARVGPRRGPRRPPRRHAAARGSPRHRALGPRRQGRRHRPRRPGRRARRGRARGPGRAVSRIDAAFARLRARASARSSRTSAPETRASR